LYPHWHSVVAAYFPEESKRMHSLSLEHGLGLLGSLEDSPFAHFPDETYPEAHASKISKKQ